MTQKNISLRARLLKMLALPLVAILVVAGAVSYYLSYDEVEEIYDSQLTLIVKVLYALAKQEIDNGDVSAKRILVDDTLELHEYEKVVSYRVWIDGRLILYSNNTADFGPPTQARGFANRIIEGDQWRFYTLYDDNIIIEAAERYEVREELIALILGSIFLPQLLIIPVLGLIIWFGVARGIKPLDVLSGIIRKRDPNNLEPIVVPVIPNEVTPVLDAINDLMERTSHVLEHEKQFSNYAAHELRTPLATIKTQLQVALRTKDQAKAKRLFAETLPATGRMQNLIEQLLTFVRVQRSDSTFGSLDFSTLCENSVREHAPEALKTSRILECDIESGIMITGNGEMLHALLRNLIGNALKYTHEGGTIHVRLEKRDNAAHLRVCDDGIGIREADRSKLFDSFYRSASTHTEGSGLGLAIVEWVASAHHAAIVITGGLKNKGSCFDLTFQCEI